MTSLLSTATVTAVGLTCKVFFNIGFFSVTVNGLPILLNALENDARTQGVVTVSNHISTLDDPVTWGVLPLRCYLSSRTTRWALGASDIMFTNPVFSTFFRLGQTLETLRGKGIYQPSVDVAIAKLNQGGWVHLFGEGKVNQPNTYRKDQCGVYKLPRFKWGVGRIIMESSVPPLVIPMWLTGFDQLMPEGRAFPYKFLPRPGAQLSITFGDPLHVRDIKKALCAENPSGPFSLDSKQRKTEGWLVGETNGELNRKRCNDTQNSMDAESKIRTEITALVQRAVESLGRSISGDSLSKSV